MILGFKTKIVGSFPAYGIEGDPTFFVEKILAGKKIHTLRMPGRWKVGNKIHFATGVRSKNYNCFKEGTVISIQKVLIDQSGKALKISVDGRLLTVKEMNRFIMQDGIDSLFVFHTFFGKGGEFDCIHWTEMRY